MGRNGNVRTVNRNRRSLELALTGAAFGALALGSPAMAADMPLKAPHLRPAFDWSGFYIGGHTGYGRGSSTASSPLSRAATTLRVLVDAESRRVRRAAGLRTGLPRCRLRGTPTPATIHCACIGKNATRFVRRASRLAA